MTGGGEMDLGRLLAAIQPELQAEDYVFCSVRQQEQVAEQDVLAWFREPEGVSLVLRREAADHAGLGYDGVWRCITLTIHSSLDAVGFTAAVAARLARHDIPANVIAAYYHDHVLVPARQAEQAVELLRGLQEPDSAQA